MVPQGFAHYHLSVSLQRQATSSRMTHVQAPPPALESHPQRLTTALAPLPSPGHQQPCVYSDISPLHAGAYVRAKSLQSCLTLCDPIDGSPPGSPVPGILQARTRVGCHLLLPTRESENQFRNLEGIKESEIFYKPYGNNG